MLVEFVHSSFSYFKIEIAYSNYTFCGTQAPSLSTFRWKNVKISANSSTPPEFTEFLLNLGNTLLNQMT